MGEPVRTVGTFAEDPLLRAIKSAPLGPPLTAAEQAAMDEGKLSLEAGEPGRSQEGVERTIEQLREEDDGADRGDDLMSRFLREEDDEEIERELRPLHLPPMPAKPAVTFDLD